MFEMRNEFATELNKLCDAVVKEGELNYDKESFKQSFFSQASHTPDNLECMEYVEFGVAMWDVYLGHTRKMYGPVIRNTDILLENIANSLEIEEVRDIIAREYPMLSNEEIEAAQRAITVIICSFTCMEIRTA